MKLSAIFLAILVSTALAMPAFAADVPLPPHQFWGAVTIGDSPAPDGTVVSAEIEGVAITWSTTTSEGKYGYSPLFKIPSDDPATPEKDGGVDGDVVVFKVSGEVAGQATFESGGHTELNLSIAAPAPPPSFTADAGGPYSGTVGESITLSGSASGGTSPYSYAWDLDNDGEYDDATGATPSHSWDAAGTYTIGLQVTDAASNTATDTATVTVIAEGEFDPYTYDQDGDNVISKSEALNALNDYNAGTISESNALAVIKLYFS